MPYIADAQICLNEARDKIVPCDSPEAYVNLALPGWELADEVAEKYGLSAAPASAAGDDKKEPEEKTVSAAPANKAVAASSNKGNAGKK